MTENVVMQHCSKSAVCRHKNPPSSGVVEGVVAVSSVLKNVIAKIDDLADGSFYKMRLLVAAAVLLFEATYWTVKEYPVR